MAMRLAYVNAQSGKNHKLFKEEVEEKPHTVSKQEKHDQLAELNSIFEE